jgi:choline dehydrogenase-like flavoprotein
LSLAPVDVVVAGAGGGIVAEQLALAGYRVALLERGRQQKFSETGHDELRSQRTTVLGNAFGPDDEHYVREVERGQGKWAKVLPSEGAYNNVAACVGGGTFSYGAMAWRFMEKDFRMKSTYGAPAGSTLEDWPIAYADLEPYYTKAEWEIGVSGQAGANTFEPPRSKPYPMPPLPLNREANMLTKAAKKLGWHPFPIPMAINSVNYMGRSGCIGCPHCVGFACEVNAKSSTAVTVIPRAIKTGNCELRTGAVVAEIMTDERGSAFAVAYTQNSQIQVQPCKAIVVSCSATETPRLLLNSKTKLFPNGLGNNNDWVGRNLMGHAYCGATGLFEEEIFDGTGPAARVAACDFSHGLPDGLKGGGMMANEFIRLQYLFSQSMLPPGMPRWGIEHKNYMRKYFKRSVGIKSPIQEMPVFESRVEISPTLREAFGIPTVRLSGHRHSHDQQVGKYVAERCEQWLKEAGASKTWTSVAGSGVSGGQHQAGTCRMGNDPKTSVVDKYCRLHDVDNVYVVDGSVHVNNGGFNPSLTIQAIAYWASARMVTDLHRV